MIDYIIFKNYNKFLFFCFQMKCKDCGYIMIFNKNSDVTIVLTSCGRFDLLKETLTSLDNFNTYPIKEIIITEDSGDDNIIKVIPKSWSDHIKIIINKKKLGQIKSIDKAYQLVDTKYIFHCEDDWLFYRKGFIEESKLILEFNDSILQVWLRDYNNDIKINYPFHYPSEKFNINNIIFYKIESNNDKWRGFSFNPGLRRKLDYDKISHYYVDNKSASETESYLTNVYHNKGMYAVFLAESAVKHIGYGFHVMSNSELLNLAIEKEKKKKIMKNKRFKHLLIGFFIGFIFGLFCIFFN